MMMSYGVPIHKLHTNNGRAVNYVLISDMPTTIGQQFMHDVLPCACPSVPKEQAFFVHDWERWCKRQGDQLHDLQLYALRKVQELANAYGSKRLTEEKDFVDEMSGEDDGIEVIVRNRFTMLTDDELAKAPIWWAGLSEVDQMRRREHAIAIRKPFGIELPEDDDDERWPSGEGWAAVCYDDEIS